ncbi:conserved hypothetical protein [Treponema phagedenis]|uniref:Uncharacterized protein n=1 Tax=Treponema phagedenis TaxID=162 RepID=A0A0B7GXU1_TREPH|nr:hypothetical protein HMPREF9554_01397 [Treponema phagedenis F0421]CEM61436.1 conserved hypothetical protein [Treponema phagedenis]
MKELRLTNISTIEQANPFLETTSLPRINKKFSVPLAFFKDAHAPACSDIRYSFLL